MAYIDFARVTAYQRYKLMASLIAPRPIARVTTLGANGVVNTQAWRVNLREFHPLGRFGASFYTRCGDRFVMGVEADGQAAPASTPIDQL